MKKFILVLTVLTSLVSGAFAKEITVVTKGKQYNADVLWANPNTENVDKVIDKACYKLSEELYTSLSELASSVGADWNHTMDERQTAIQNLGHILGDCVYEVPLSELDDEIVGSVIYRTGAASNPKLGAVVRMSLPDVIYTDDVIIVLRGQNYVVFYIDYEEVADKMMELL